jgi:predicted nucleic acid-binding Zn ribbon protein
MNRLAQAAEPCKCHVCQTPLPNQRLRRGRPQRFCSDRCRKAWSRINGHENRARGPIYQGGKNADFGPLQPIDFVDAACPEIPEQEPSRLSASFSKELYFEEYAPRQKKTYRLTDGQQINTGSGRISRALGYVMEIEDGRWVARVKNLSSAPLPLGAAKKAAIEFFESSDKGEPRDWIRALNLATAQLVDETGRAQERRERASRMKPTDWPVDVLGGPNSCSDLRHEILNTETPILVTVQHVDLEYEENGFPKLPKCLARHEA